jgi:hypothetical protein
MSPNRLLLVLVVLSVATVILGLLFPAFLVLIQAAIDVITPGRSHVKLFLCLSYLIVLLFLARKAQSGKTLQRGERTFAKTVISLIAIGYLFNVISYFWFLLKYHFAVTDFIITVNNGELSSGKFTHNHVLKGAIGLFAQWYRHGIYPLADAGTAFVGLLPSWFFVTTALLFICMVIACVYYFYISFTKYSKTTLSALFYIISYWLTTFILLKGILDGGLFDFSTLPAFLMLNILLFGWPRRKVFLFVMVTLIELILAGYAIIYKTYSSDEFGYTYFVFEYFLVMVILLAPVCVLFRPKRDYITALIVLAGVTALAGGMGINFFGTRGVEVYRDQKIPALGATVATYKHIFKKNYTLIDSIGKLNIYRLVPDSSITVGDVIDENELLTSYSPVWPLSEGCVAYPILQYKMVLTTIEPFTPTGTALIPSASLSLISVKDHIYKYDVTLRLPSCYPEQMNQFGEYFSSQNLKTFFITQVSAGKYEQASL